MSKEQSTLVKGLAILMMLFLHLFNSSDLASYCTPLLWIGNLPLVNIITRSCGPVGIFLLVSGYGLSYCYDHGRSGTSDNFKRIIKLYLYYWFILLIFVFIGSFVRPDKYPGTLSEMLGNFIGLNNSYNAPTWFLFPYVLLAITSPFIFRVMNRIGNISSFLISSFLFFASAFIIHAYIAPNHLNGEWWVQIVTYFDLLISFVMGAILYRYGKHHSLHCAWLTKHGVVAVMLFIVFFCLHFFTTFQGIGPYFEFVLVLLFLQINLKKNIRKFFLTMGKYSMAMWLTHAYYCTYLFHDFIYGFKYPLIIYIVLIIISYATAWCVMHIMKPVIRLIK